MSEAKSGTVRAATPPPHVAALHLSAEARLRGRRRMRATTYPPSMNLRLRGRLGAGEEIEIAALVGLADMGGEHRAVAARVARRRRPPCGAAAVELVVADMQVDAARRDIDLD